MLIRLAKELDWVAYTVLRPEPEEKLNIPISNTASSKSASSLRGSKVSAILDLRIKLEESTFLNT